jgi:hypothetical protein
MRARWIVAGLVVVVVGFVIGLVATDREGEAPSHAPKVEQAPSPAGQLPRSLRAAFHSQLDLVRSVRCRDVSLVRGVAADRKCTVELRGDGRRTFIKRHGGWLGIGVTRAQTSS